MSRKSRYLIAALVVVILGAVGGLFYILRDDVGGRETQTEAQAELCSEHRVPEKTCPFCHPDLVKEMGHCAEHDVPEALCYQCRPELVAGFKATHNWCGEHGVPESWCPL